MKSIIFFLMFLTAVSGTAQKVAYANYSRPLSGIIKSEKLDKSKISILIDKSDHKLTVRIGDQAVKEYPVVFGRNSSADKLMQGDYRTPEGVFKVVTYYPHRKWSKFILIDYPNEDSWKKHNDAKQAGTIPQNAKIGGEIGIHGVPAGLNSLIDSRENWTLGCISMKNKDVDELYSFISKSTVVTIIK